MVKNQQPITVESKRWDKNHKFQLILKIKFLQQTQTFLSKMQQLMFKEHKHIRDYKQ